MFVNCSMFVLSAIPSPNPLLLSMKVLYYFSPVCWVVPARSTLSLASLRMLSVERSSSCPAMTVTMFMTFWIALVESALCASCFTKSVLSCYANVVSAAIQYFQFFLVLPAICSKRVWPCCLKTNSVGFAHVARYKLSTTEYT